MPARPSRVTRLLFWSLAVAVVVGVSATATAKPAKPAKSTSGVIYASGNHVEGTDLYVSGDFKDKLLGRGAIVYIVQASSGPEPGSVLVKAEKITIYTTKGSLTGTGQATLTYNPDGTATVSDGTFKLTKGTGAYKGHTLKGTFTGTQGTDFIFIFNYTGKYK